MLKTESNPRRDFLKKIPFALVSLSAISMFHIKKSINNSENKFKTISKSEADDIIKSEKFSVSATLKPKPAPLMQKQ